MPIMGTRSSPCAPVNPDPEPLSQYIYASACLPRPFAEKYVAKSHRRQTGRHMRAGDSGRNAYSAYRSPGRPVSRSVDRACTVLLHGMFSGFREAVSRLRSPCPASPATSPRRASSRRRLQGPPPSSFLHVSSRRRWCPGTTARKEKPVAPTVLTYGLRALNVLTFWLL